MRKTNKNYAMCLFASLALNIGVAQASTVNCHLPKRMSEKIGWLSVSWALYTELMGGVVSPSRLILNVNGRHDKFSKDFRFPDRPLETTEFSIDGVGEIMQVRYWLPITSTIGFDVVLLKSSGDLYFGVPKDSYVIKEITQISHTGMKSKIQKRIFKDYTKPEHVRAGIINSYYYSSEYYDGEGLDELLLNCSYAFEEGDEERD